MQRVQTQPTGTEWERFFQGMFMLCGLDLREYQQDQLRRRILALMSSERVKSLDALFRLLARDPLGVRRFMASLNICVSEFYRDPSKWQELRARILPDLFRQQPHLKCWSAGCSFGAEAHTLAIILDVHFPGRHSILCTDVDEVALERVRMGEFSDHEMRRVPGEVRMAYFDWNPFLELWKAKASLSNRLRTEAHDLLAGEFESGFDLILCRNVFIYLNETAREALTEKFHRALRPGGVLFLGSTEKLPHPSDFGFDSALPGFYQKPLHAQVLAAA